MSVPPKPVSISFVVAQAFLPVRFANVLYSFRTIMITSTEAIILKSTKYRDSAKLLTAYTEAFGRCSLIANGARSAKNKYGTALEPMSCSSLTFYKKQNKDLHTLSGAEASVRLRNISESFERMTTGLAMCEIIYASQIHEEQNTDVYQLLKSCLLALNTIEDGAESSLLVWFQIRYASVLGFALNPSICAASGESVLVQYLPEAESSPHSEKEYIVSLADGAPFSEVYARINTGFRMRSATLHALQTLYATSLENVGQYRLTAQQISQLDDFFALYYQFHLERSLADKTRRFMQSVAAAG
ncbi:MAG: DNA repair protein RecO [Candidatus Kapaibacterium sp.]|nr:MAG: DNA repair protein RecO [Candidatus Kapabacteria bacterium]